jgi:four helix bundle protein
MAFDFEKLIVYQKAKVFNHSISTLLEIIPVTRNKKDQLDRASFSILLNIAEGTG